MELSKKDRVILINQYHILSLLDPENSSNYEEIIEILQRGYTIFYSKVDEWVSDDMSVDDGHFVHQILNIYRQIEGYKQKHPDDKEVNEHLFSVFSGFDGNEESRFYSFTRFVIERQDRFAEQKPYWQQTDGLNSHMPMKDKYEKMIAKWEATGGGYDFDRERILAILNA
jgi:uncharacterized protein YfbU (UPF0304 family)